ncbi:MAG: VOC family protein [Opitutaceae bacterium]|nr:VOC family protein [Opitutaceae bacterium]
MKFEHFALNVPAPREMAAWYVAHLGLQILRSSDTGSLAHFLGDDSGRVFFELYHNPVAPVPDYAAQNPLTFHFALFAPDAKALRAALVAAGATLLSEDTLADGSVLVMLRDPWGVALQLCQRARPFPGF